MKKNLLIFLLVFATHISFNQVYYGQSWMMGNYGAFVKFTSNSYVLDTSYLSVAYFGSGKSNICDSNGNIHLISNGMDIYNRNGSLIQNGGNLVDCQTYYTSSGSSADQSSIFLPVKNNKCYYFFPTVSDSMYNAWKTPNSIKGGFDRFYYNEIDIYGNGGLGKVTKRKVKLLDSVELCQSQMMACKHGNGSDWWLIKKGRGNKLYIFQITQDSVYNKGIQQIPFTYFPYWEWEGQMVFNNEGSKWATTDWSDKQVYIADFDRCYGTFTNFENILPPPQLISGTDTDKLVSGLCFSPNGKYLYVAKENSILQYDLQNKTWYKVFDQDTSSSDFMIYRGLSLAPNGKIYIGYYHGLAKEYSVIDNPNGDKSNCNFCRKCFRTNTITSAGTLSSLPCMPNYSLGSKICYPNNSEEVLKSNDELIIYPNPTNSKIYIKYVIATKETISKQLYNSIGQLLITTQENEIDIQHLPKGIYFLKCANQTKKVIIE